MSNENVQEKKQAALVNIRNDLAITVLWACIGYAVMILGSEIFSGLASGLLLLAGFVIIPVPFYKKGLMFWMEDYEIITTYSDGSKSSDYGAAAATNNLFGIIFTVVLGILATAVKIVWLIIKYCIAFLIVKKKPSVFKSAFPIMLAGFVVLVAVPVIQQSIATGKAVAIQKEQDDLNAAAETYKLNVSPESGYPVVVTDVLYRPDFTVVRVVETKEAAIKPFIFSNYPDTRFYNSKVTTAFKVVTASGKEYSSSNTRFIATSETGDYNGFELFFPTEFTDTSFDMIETSTIPNADGWGNNPDKLLVFKNVRVNK